MANVDTWLPVWAALSDETLGQRLRHYFWLSIKAPYVYPGRFEQLAAEAKRRGKPEMVDRAKQWVTRYGNAQT